MRDPQARLEFAGDRVVRTFEVAPDERHFLHSALAARWSEQGRIVPFRHVDERSFESPRVPFVSYPDEWCDAQLWDAGTLTLSLHEEAVAAGFDLKDASAWNVLFDRGQPVLCDHGSLVPLTTRRWWAAGQYGRHFVLPLLLSRRCGLQARQAFSLWRDGVPPDSAAALLGWRRYLSRYWPLTSQTQGAPGLEPAATADMAEIGRFRERLNASLRWMLDGVAARDHGGAAEWRRYTADGREHYPGSSLAAKQRAVARWLSELSPTWVVDLGCNTGEFSRLALEAGAEVIAVDADHDSVQALYTVARGRPIHPVVAPLDDMSSGRGWMGTEHDGLMQRIAPRGELVLMLALIHHLAVAQAVPLVEVARFASGLTRRRLVLELIHEKDPQLQLLCRQRRRDASTLGADRQLAAFQAAGFVVEQRVDLAPAARELVLLRRAGDGA